MPFLPRGSGRGKYLNARLRGYTRCVVTPDTWRADYRVVPSATDTAAPAVTDATWVVESAGRGRSRHEPRQRGLATPGRGGPGRCYRRVMSTVAQTSSLGYREPQGRWVLAATVLGTGMAFLDATVVNVALPAIGADLDTDFAGLQWTVNAYTLTLASFILLGGSLGDRFGRKRVFLVGVVWFATASLLCGLAPNIGMLIAARALQGVGGALLTPGSLAILQASFRQEDRGAAIGAWSGLAGVAAAVGPFLGGWLVDVWSWRLAFLINVPIAAAVVVVSVRHVPESADSSAAHRFDVPGALLCATALGGLTYGFISWGERGLSQTQTLIAFALGVLASAAFVAVERGSTSPMLPFGVFSSRLFRNVNLVTFVVYAALGGLFFMLVVTLQVVAGWSPLLAGTALMPVTLLMLVLSSRAGDLSQRIGPRIPMTVGPLLAAAGVLLLAPIGPGATYLGSVLAGVTVFGLGLSATVAPLTATVLAAAPVRHAGIASGVNNAIARSAGLLVVAALPALIGLSPGAYTDPALMQPAFARAMFLCAGLLALGGLYSLVAIRPDGVPIVAEGAEPEAPAPREHVHTPECACRVHCAVAGTPLEP
jgi:EmrB/QacA subfamily drug resistance transporter